MGLSLTERQVPLSSLFDKHVAFYLARIPESILAWADGYDAKHLREVERIVRGALSADKIERIVRGALPDGDGFCSTRDVAELARALLELVVAVHHGASAAGQRVLVIKRAEQARLKKQANDIEEQFRVVSAVKRVTDRLGNPKKPDYKPGDKLPLSDTYAAAIRDQVLKELRRPPDAKKPSVRGIRRAFKQINDGSLFQIDPLKGFALKD
jgi:hypothetical protein